MKEVCKVSENSNYLINYSTIENALIFNECNKIPIISKALEYLQKEDENKYSPENIVDNIIELSSRNKKHCPNSITKLILDSKFLDLNLEIIFDDSSDKTPNISQIKILLKISYINLSSMKKSELNLILNEEEFNKVLLEIEGLQKGL